MSKVVVTGATGFVGRALIDSLAASGMRVVAGLRDRAQPPSLPYESLRIDLDRTELLHPGMFAGVEYLFHVAAQVHVLRPDAAMSSMFGLRNAIATEKLARIAAAAGVRRFLFVSSIKVNGEITRERAFTAFDEPAPKDDYGRSKLLAEQALGRVASETGIEIVVIRPPLVYGPGVRANFLRLLQLVYAEFPLPFASVNNIRSFVSVWNLCDLLHKTMSHPRAPGRTWIASDDRDLSTPELIALLGRSMCRTVRLLPCPVAVLEAASTLIGRRSEFERILGSLRVDVSETKSILDWTPPVSPEEGLQRTADWYLKVRADR